ncbi:hypothetical protein V8E55_007114 [Tylopilus felleus]
MRPPDPPLPIPVPLSARIGPNVTQTGDRSASANDQGASTPLNFVLAVLSVVLPLVLLIVCYNVYKRLVLKVCSLLCPPRHGLHSTELVHADDSDSFHCVTSHQIQLERRPCHPSVDDPLRVKQDSEPMERPSRPTTASPAISVGSAIDLDMTAVPTGTGGTNEPSQWQLDKQPPVRPSPPEDGLPFPGDPDCAGSLRTQYICIENLKHAELKELCRKFHLPLGGNKQVLQQRLQDLSGDRDAWDSLLPGTTRPHKGSRGSGTGSSVLAVEKTKKTRMKRSAKRRELLLSKDTPTGTQTAGMSPSVERSKDTHTQAEKDAVIPWAQSVVTRHPYHPPLPPLPQLLAPQTQPMASPSSASVPPRPSRSSLTQHDIMRSHPTVLPVAVLPSLPPQSMVSAPPPVQASRAVPHHAVPPSLIQGTSTPWAQTRSVVQASNLSYCTQLKSLTLGDGTVLTFTTDDIPDPPLPRTAFLCIKDRPIAVKYWPTVYCHTKDPQKCKQWQGTKNNWCKWKDVIERYRQGTPEQFWEKFSQNGKRMSFTVIDRHLRLIRKEENDRATEEAWLPEGWGGARAPQAIGDCEKAGIARR